MAPLEQSDKARIPGIPADFPVSLSGELCWDTDTFRDASYKYIVHLSLGDIESIEKAIASFKSTFLVSFTRLC